MAVFCRPTVRAVAAPLELSRLPVSSLRAAPYRHTVMTYAKHESCVLSLGSNLGDRLENLHCALALLQEDASIRLLDTAQLYESKPMYLLDQPTFLNTVCRVRLLLLLWSTRLFSVLKSSRLGLWADLDKPFTRRPSPGSQTHRVCARSTKDNRKWATRD